jgi:hypothetical protein
MDSLNLADVAGRCDGDDAGDGRCVSCTLPMDRHPVNFVYPGKGDELVADLDPRRAVRAGKIMARRKTDG